MSHRADTVTRRGRSTLTQLLIGRNVHSADTGSGCDDYDFSPLRYRASMVYEHSCCLEDKVNHFSSWKWLIVI